MLTIIYQFFEGCKDFNEVNDLFNKYCYNGTLEERESLRFDSILTEYDLISNSDVTFPLKNFNGTYFTNSSGQQIYREDKRKYTKKDIVTPIIFIGEAFKKIEKLNQKRGSLYFKYLVFINDTKFAHKRESIEMIARLCGYNEGWVYHKCKELNIT